MNATSLYERNGLWHQIAGAGTPEVVIASVFVLAAVISVFTWRARARAAQRLRAAARAYADREIARQNQLETSGCPA
jgi:3-hydroxyacyl-CoA dehydrogenase